MSSVALVLVDFDDTLVDTAPRFARARRALFELLAESGFDVQEAERIHHEEVDPSMRARHGFGPQRIGPAFVGTYRALCSALTRPFDDDVERRCLDLAAAVAGTPAVFDGALAALRRLARHHPTVIYTQSGDAQYQLRCVRETGAMECVGEARVRVVDVKTADALQEALDAFGVHDPATAWMIGNSIRSDINPALELGVNAILVDQEDPWHHDVVEPLHPHFTRVGRFADAVELLVDR